MFISLLSFANDDAYIEYINDHVASGMMNRVFAEVCYAEYSYIVDMSKKTYFGHTYFPSENNIFLTQLMDDFHTTFPEIRIIPLKLLVRRKVYPTNEKYYFTYKYSEYCMEKPAKDEEHIILYRLEFSTLYSEDQIFTLTYILSQLFRMYDPQYNFISGQELKILDTDEVIFLDSMPINKNTDLIRYIVDANKRGYGIWARDVPYSKLMLVNDHEFLDSKAMRNYFERLHSKTQPRGTTFFDAIFWDVENHRYYKIDEDDEDDEDEDNDDDGE